MSLLNRCRAEYEIHKRRKLFFNYFFRSFVSKNKLFFFRQNISQYTDEQLIKLYRESGQPEYFGELYNRYIPLLYGICLKYLGDEVRAQDAVMQLFEELLPKINRYEIQVFRTWVYSVAKNHCLRLLRKKEPEIRFGSDTSIMEYAGIVYLLSEEEDAERIELLRKCMEILPEPQRISISFFFMEEKSYADIVEATGYHLKSVKSYIQNGKRNLKLCIEKHTDK